MAMDENHPIYKAIDRGGGQTCDIAGVIRELDKAGFVIVPRMKSMTDKKPELVIETAARAIYEARNGRGCKAWSLLPGSHKEPYLADAKAAIDAYHDYIRRYS